jgi:hypothetical protein
VRVICTFSRRTRERPRRLLLCVGLAALAAAVVAAMPVVTSHSSSATAAPKSVAAVSGAGTFNTNLLLKGSSGAAEPSIRTDRYGRSYVIAPIGVPAGCKAFRISHDGSASTYLGFPDSTAGGGDCDWAIGPKETAPGSNATGDTIAYSSLTLANVTVGKSTNGGASFGLPNPAAAQIAGDDRMWMDADPKANALGYANVFLDYHDIDTDDIQLSISTDGGQTYLQSGPIINNQDVPPGQWAATCPAATCIAAPSSAGAGNELGNLVAKRPKGAGLKIYSIFTTPDSETDNFVGTGGQSRVYEAIGTATDNPAGGPPLISWRNYEIWHGPVGSRYDRIFPVTAVDNAGHVYAVWSDGANEYVKTSADGTSWGCPAASTVPGGTAPCTQPSTIPNPAGVNTTVFPWIAGGADGIADVVFYGAQAPTAGDFGNASDVWNVYMAQTTDRGKTWSVSTASDHSIHSGGICMGGIGCAAGRTLLDFFQVSIDPTNGAADIAYADDHASPGTPVVYFTRQCTGTSATSGAALANDCVVPPPPVAPPPGSTCPGPQVADFVGDAPNNYPAGDGANMDALDYVSASFATPDATHLQVTLKLKDLEPPPPPANMISALWTVYWNYNGTTYFAQATGNGTGAQTVWAFNDGTWDGSSWNVGSGTPTGTATLGPNGTFVITMLRSDVGNPPDGAHLTGAWADVHGSLTAQGTGEYYTTPADRAPDTDFGSDYVVAQTC